MRLGLDISQYQLTWDELLARAQLAEDAGFDGAWVFDHFEPLYGEPTGPCLEGWTLLAALAAATTRIRLGALVTGVTYRHPSVLAAEAVTVDHVSNGRLELGMGAAWHNGEHGALGIPYPSTRERIDRLEEALQVMRLLMTDDGVSFGGRYYQLDDATYRPRPVQQPHPPIWVGANGLRRTIPLAGKYADVWHGFGDPGRHEEGAAVLNEAAERAGRDPATILRATNLSLSHPWDEVRRRAAALADVGVGYLVISWPSEGRGHLEEFIEQVMPEVAALGS